jgi:recombination protein RecA
MPGNLLLLMIAREKIKKSQGGGNYFSSPKTNIEFIPSGCKMLDLALGGGWAESRCCNIIGDKAAGKTLLAQQASANFALKYPGNKIYYREPESAWITAYAEAIGMPTDVVDFSRPQTIEEVYDDLSRVCDKNVESLYVLDSLDACSSKAEMETDIDEGSYGTGKARKMSEMFRRLIQRVESSKTTLMIISQIRDVLNALPFQKKWTRSGGRAMDFYASQVLFLVVTGKVPKTIKGVKRVIGVDVHARVEKNKIALPFREAEFQVLFGYGLHDMQASLEFLKSIKALGEVDLSDSSYKKFLGDCSSLSWEEYEEHLDRINAAAEKQWYEIEAKSMEGLPPRRVK